MSKIFTTSANKPITHYRLLLDIDSPCEMLADYKGFKTWAANHEFTGYLKEVCRLEFEDRVENAMRDLNACLPESKGGRRWKRDAISTIFDVVGTGVTNLISGAFARSDSDRLEEVHDRLSKDVYEAGRHILLSQDGMRNDIITEVKLASQTSERHKDTLLQAIKDVLLRQGK